MAYLAKWDGGQTYLSKDTQMEEYLEKGASIYCESNNHQSLIATPEKGFLIERPVFPIVASSSIIDNNQNDYETAAKILLGLEE